MENNSVENFAYVIGISEVSGQQILNLPTGYMDKINDCDVLVGGERLLEYVKEHFNESSNANSKLWAKDEIIIKSSLSENVQQISAHLKNNKKVVILASGDPLYYGIGGYLSKKIPVLILPSLSSIQLAAARAKISWHDVLSISLHGRSMFGLAQKIDGKQKVCLLTDPENNPPKIAQYLQDFGMFEYSIFVAENLGLENEKTSWHNVKELALAKPDKFSELNVTFLVVENQTAETTDNKILKKTFWGLGDEDFEDREKGGLITKKEIRTLTLAALRLNVDSVVWDIGACTGSIAIEAARTATEGKVYAIEKSKNEYENLLINSRKFRADITAQNAKAPEGLDQFADPDAVFIGGSGGNLDDILATCSSRLNDNGVIVVNAATIETLHQAVKFFENENFTLGITHVQISRSRPILNMTRFESLNPVYIISASRKSGENINRKKSK